MLPVVRILGTGAAARSFALLLGSLVFAGCSLKSANEGARLSLVLPNPRTFSQSNLSGPQGVAPAAWNSPDFVCYGVNVTGPGIADSSANPKPNPDVANLLSGTNSCAYRGVVSNGFSFSAGQSEAAIDLQVPPGTNRVIQLIGIKNAAFCGTNFLNNGVSGSPEAYEIGRTVADLFADATVTIPVTYFQSESKRVDCGGAPATIATNPPDILISPPSVTLNVGTPAGSPISISNAGDPITGCSVSPALPTGLTLDPVTCLLSGTPTVAVPSASYTFTATNAGGSDTGSVTIAVNDIAPVVTFAGGPYSFVQGTAISALTPTLSGGAVVSCSSSPALPTGLVLNSLNCAISGTPSVVAASQTYTVTAVAFGGASGSGTVTFAVAAPASLAWSPMSQNFGSVTVGTNSATQAFTLTNSGGTPVTGCTAPSLGGVDSADFTLVSTTCTATLAGGGSCSVDVRANPGTAGAKTSHLTIMCTETGITMSGNNQITVTGVAPVAGHTIAIDGGSAGTNSTTVSLALSATGATEMYVTNDASCLTGGTWEPYATSKPTWTLGQMNGTATVAVKFRNAAMTDSSCINDTIVHDNIPPTTPSFVSYLTPASSPAFVNNPTVVVNGTSAGDTIKVYTDSGCTALAGVSSGSAGATPVSLSGLVAGANSLYARAFDALSNASGCTTTPLTYYYDDACDVIVGSGTAGDPYQISRWEQLRNCLPGEGPGLSAPLDGPNVFFRLTQDIFLATVTPIPMLRGVLDGGGRILQNFYLDAPGLDNQGLFAVVDGGYVHDLVMNTVTLKCRDRCGIIAGEAMGQALFENVTVTSGAAIALEGRNDVGGIVGRATGGAVRFRMNRAETLEVQIAAGGAGFGGIVGKYVKDTLLTGDDFYRNRVSGQVVSGGFCGNDMGGIAGKAEIFVDTGTLKFRENSQRLNFNCSSQSNVQHVGGIAGFLGAQGGNGSSIYVSDAHVVGTFTGNGTGSQGWGGIAGWVSPGPGTGNSLTIESSMVRSATASAYSTFGAALGGSAGGNTFPISINSFYYYYNHGPYVGTYSPNPTLDTSTSTVAGTFNAQSYLQDVANLPGGSFANAGVWTIPGVGTDPKLAFEPSAFAP